MTLLRRSTNVSLTIVFWLLSAIPLAAEPTALLRGEIVDMESGKPLPARIYVRSAAGEWFFAKSTAGDGTAVEYRRQRQAGSEEMHTTLSAHPFALPLPPGKYTVTVERGKEYLPFEQQVMVDKEQVNLRIPLRRWIDMASDGWYSGDTHVHRSLEELPNVIQAEDLNVTLPLSYWVTKAHTPPTAGDKNTGQNLRPEPILVDPTHVIYPVNTEYEIFSVAGKSHTLGAVFVLGHKTPFDSGVPPVRPIAERARREGALLDLDKHSWPWSIMLVPVMKVDLFELANNHVWRTKFGFRQWTIETLPEYMHLETTPEGFTEWGWIEFGFQNYYAFLNCGFRLRPTAGTASGVHPVPLGFGRVYVQLPNGFDYEAWMQGLNAGRSFVTTGPMLLVEVDGHPPGHVFTDAVDGSAHRIHGSAASAVPLDRIEIIVNGEVAKTVRPLNERATQGGYRNPIDEKLTLHGSGWIAVRAFEARPDERVRFAHTGPVHIDVAGKPLRPRREEVEYLVRRVREELARHEGVLPAEAIAEYRDALRIYEDLLRNAR